MNIGLAYSFVVIWHGELGDIILMLQRVSRGSCMFKKTSSKLSRSQPFYLSPSTTPLSFSVYFRCAFISSYLSPSVVSINIS